DWIDIVDRARVNDVTQLRVTERELRVVADAEVETIRACNGHAVRIIDLQVQVIGSVDPGHSWACADAAYDWRNVRTRIRRYVDCIGTGRSWHGARKRIDRFDLNARQAWTSAWHQPTSDETAFGGRQHRTRFSNAVVHAGSSGDV